MQGICNYIPETNHVPRLYNSAVSLQLQFMVHVILLSMLNILYFYVSTFQYMCAVANTTVFCISVCNPGLSSPLLIELKLK
jgi:predicted Na+-dependent transporter